MKCLSSFNQSDAPSDSTAIFNKQSSVSITPPDSLIALSASPIGLSFSLIDASAGSIGIADSPVGASAGSVGVSCWSIIATYGSLGLSAG
jgi:hypothetical protein